MKKIAVFVALSLMAASSAFAATTLDIDFAKAGQTLRGHKTTVAADSPLVGKLSTGVSLGFFGNADGTGYSLITQHRNGTKLYGSSFDSTSIYSADIASDQVGVAGGGVMTKPTAITSSDFMDTSKWSSL